MKRTALKRKNGRGDPKFLKPKTCAICEMPFQPRNGIQKYCGPLCQQAAEYKTRICERCGSRFTRSYRNAHLRFCSKACANKATGPARGRAMRSSSVWCLANKGEEACRSCGQAAGHLHHIVPRSKSRALREDITANGLPLCPPCHRGWHDRNVVIYHDILTDIEFMAAVEHGGVIWVERNYPDREYIALQRLDELANRRCLLPRRGETIDERINRIREAVQQAYAVELVGLEEARRYVTNERAAA